VAAAAAFLSCEEQQQRWRAEQERRWWRGEPWQPRDDQVNHLAGLWGDAFDAVVSIPATTQSGLRAKAKALQVALGSGVEQLAGPASRPCARIGSIAEPTGDVHDMLAWSLAKDLIAWTDGATPTLR